MCNIKWQICIFMSEYIVRKAWHILPFQLFLSSFRLQTQNKGKFLSKTIYICILYICILVLSASICTYTARHVKVMCVCIVNIFFLKRYKLSFSRHLKFSTYSCVNLNYLYFILLCCNNATPV